MTQRADELNNQSMNFISLHQDFPSTGRRSIEKKGWVNFPVEDPFWTNTMEGGMFVKLVVSEKKNSDECFGVCCGCEVFDAKSEVLISDSLRPEPIKKYQEVNFLDKDRSAPNKEDYEKLCEELLSEVKERRDWESYHFPFVHKEYDDPNFSDSSRPYLAVLLLGSTGWSGWSDALSRYWNCTEEDLTEEGKELFRNLKNLYEGCDIHLLTFLDT